jgi:hypothetical protein
VALGNGRRLSVDPGRCPLIAPATRRFQRAHGFAGGQQLETRRDIPYQSPPVPSSPPRRSLRRENRVNQTPRRLLNPR